MTRVFVHLVVSLAVFLAAISCGESAKKQEAERTDSSPLDSLSWMSGLWVSEFAEFTVYESWEPTGNGMRGESHRVVGEDTVFSEKLMLFSDSGKVFYRAVVAENEGGVDFRMVKSDSLNLVFENLEHDFPNRILYKRSGTDSLYAFIEGKTPGGKTRLVFAGRPVEIKSLHC